MKAITTFSAKNYDDYAHRLLKSIDRWPGTLIAYVEEQPDFTHEKIEYRDFWDVKLPGGPSIQDFIDEVTKMGLDGGDPYNYNEDVAKFCRKVFVQYDALKGQKDKMFWLDADIEITDDIPKEFLQDLFMGHPLCYLGRQGFYSECSFIGFDMSHNILRHFLSDYVSMFTTGQILQYKWWHDCTAFDVTRQKYDIFGHNLSPYFRMGRGLHVFPDSVLADYMRHDKGNRKYK